MTAQQQRRGMTLVEVVVAVILASLLMGFIFRTFVFQRQAWRTVEKLDAIQKLRVAEKRLRLELDQATAILYPPCDYTGNTAYHRVVFAGPTNALRAIYVDDDRSLKVRSLDEEPRLLCENIHSFTVRHALKGQIACEITIDSGDRGKVSAGISAFTGNAFAGM